MIFQNAPTIKNLLFGRKVHAHLHMTRIPISEIPETNEGAAQWLYDRYVIKVQHLYNNFFESLIYFIKAMQ